MTLPASLIRDDVEAFTACADELLTCHMSKALRMLSREALDDPYQRGLAYVLAGLTHGAYDDRRLASLDKRAVAYARLDPHRSPAQLISAERIAA